MKDPRNINPYENLREILGEELGNALYDCVNHVFEYKEDINIQFAIQQFIGFVEAKHRGSIINLAESMGLTKEEWNIIRKDGITNHYDIKEELDEYFNNEQN